VELYIRVKVRFEESHFDEPGHCDLTRRVFGPEGVYEYRKERTFVNNADREAVFAELLSGFRAMPSRTSSGPTFPGGFP
jgi:hypothetical protein